MSETIPRCVNHRDVETRLSCSSCGDAICAKCVRPAAVGQKCPSCARVPRSARALGRPVHYVRAVGAGAATALVGGAVLRQVLVAIGFGTLILSALLGFLVGKAVGWGAARQAQRPFVVIAVTMAVAGVALAEVLAFGTPLPPNIWFLLAYPLAGWFAARGLQA